jgi:hypothetical protein
MTVRNTQQDDYREVPSDLFNENKLLTDETIGY